MTYEDFLRRRIREILEDRPITPNPFVTAMRFEDGRLVFEVERPADITPAGVDDARARARRAAPARGGR